MTRSHEGKNIEGALRQAIEESNLPKFEEALQAQLDWAKNSKDAAVWKMLLAQNQQLAQIIAREQTGLQGFLVSQRQKKQAVKKYEGY